MKRVALTGGIGTGKSFVRAEFARLGVPTVDADTLAHEAVAQGTAGLAAVIERFGKDVINPSGGLNRQRLGQIVFADPVARRDLEAIVHPAVRAATEAFFHGLPESHAFAIAEIPLLYEVRRDRDFDLVIVAAVDPNTQLERVMLRDGLSKEDARSRIATQLPIQEKVKRADFVIDTGGSFDDTRAQVRQVHAAVMAVR